MLALFPQAISPSDPGAGQCSPPKVESVTRWATSNEQEPTPPGLGRNPGTHNNSAERELDGFLLIRGVAAGSTELPLQPISDAHPYGRKRGKKFDHALRPAGSRHRRKTGGAPQPAQVVGLPETDLPFVVCSVRCHRAGLWLAN